MTIFSIKLTNESKDQLLSNINYRWFNVPESCNHDPTIGEQQNLRLKNIIINNQIWWFATKFILVLFYIHKWWYSYKIFQSNIKKEIRHFNQLLLKPSSQQKISNSLKSIVQNTPKPFNFFNFFIFRTIN